MTNFEFVFSLLVILLGLALAAVLGGVARVMKVRPRIRVGWATALLAAWVTTETIIFWQIFWHMRAALPPIAAVLFAGFIITSLYYFAAASVFPDELEQVSSLDDYFMQEKARVIGAVLLAFPLAMVLWRTVLGPKAYDVFNWFDWTSFAIMYVAGPVALLTKRRKLAVACLAVLVIVDLLDPVSTVLLGSS